VQDALEVNFEMELGSASESVTVEGGVSRLDTESSSLGTVVERREANELPLNGRNVFNLIALAPSVIPQGSAMGTPVGVNPFGWGITRSAVHSATRAWSIWTGSLSTLPISMCLS